MSSSNEKNEGDTSPPKEKEITYMTKNSLRHSDDKVKKHLRNLKRSSVAAGGEIKYAPRKSYQVKGAHDKSYLDISQLRLTQSMDSGTTDSGETTSESESRDSDSVRKSVSQFFQASRDPSQDERESYASIDYFEETARRKTIAKPSIKKVTMFSGIPVTPMIFQGRYNMKPSSDVALITTKNKGFSEISILDTTTSEGEISPTKGQIKWKYTVETQHLRAIEKRRGYYSENISPLLRPEKIIAQRHEKIEELRQYAIEMEHMGGEGEEVGELSDMEKDWMKDFPPIYKVLNPEPALAEFNLPVAYKEPNLASKGRMPKYAPHLENVPAVTTKRNFLQPEENWVVYETEPNVAFPIATFKPKSYILHFTEPGALPRKVAVERKRRNYLNCNLEELLVEHGLTDEDLLPPSTSDTENFSLYCTNKLLPLESFDNEEFDPCSADDWLRMGNINGVQHPIPAVAFVPVAKEKLPSLNIGKSSLRYTSKEHSRFFNEVKKVKMQKPGPVQYLWMDVAVTSYNKKYRKWSVMTLDGSQTKFNLPRIYVMFRAEDPLNYTWRLLDAVSRRRITEQFLKCNIYCDCLTVKGLNKIDRASLTRIFKSVTRNGFIRGKEEILDELAVDFQYAHRKVQAIMSFKHVIKKYPDMFSFIGMPVSKAEETVEDLPFINPNAKNFQKIRSALKRWWLYVSDETYLGMKNVVAACLQISTMNFFALNFGKYVSLEEFDSLQTISTNNVLKHLKNDWVDRVITNVRMCLQDIKKGWFNIKEKSWPIYELSKLRRFMELIKFKMETALKYLVENSMDLLLKIIEGPCLVCSEVEDDFIWGPDLLNSKFKPYVAPIFTLTLKLNNVEPFYSTNPQAFEDVLLRLFDNAIIQSHTVHQIQPYLLLNLRFPELFLSSIGLLDPIITAKRDRLRTYISKALIPLKAYANEYRKYLDLQRMDVNEYIT